MHDLLIPTYIIIFLYGIIIGSFLNVCIYRIPKNENIVVISSHCMQCGYELKWYDLIPIFSFLFLKGKCRECRAKIPLQYPLVEGLNGILYVVVFLANGFQWSSVIYCLLTSALLVLSIIDLCTFTIPPGINWFILGLGVVRVIMDYTHWHRYLLGGISVSGLLLLIFWLTKGNGIGGGDIKLMCSAGLVLGWEKILLAFFLSCIMGSVIHLIRMKLTKESHVLAMGPYLSVGIWIGALFGDSMIQWYLGIIGM